MINEKTIEQAIEVLRDDSPPDVDVEETIEHISTSQLYRKQLRRVLQHPHATRKNGDLTARGKDLAVTFAVGFMTGEASALNYLDSALDTALGSKIPEEEEPNAQ